MPNGADKLTTGEAAELCSVTRDTVLKWIKHGRLSAERTAGGHFRIVPEELERIAPTTKVVEAPAQALRCWEYMAANGSPGTECHQCIAYLAGVERCYLLRGRGDTVSFCRGPESCEDCPYYRAASGLPARVLVVSEDETLLERLRAGEMEDLEMQFARNGYEAANAVGHFHPGFVVVDEEADQGGGARLVKELETDCRSPGLRILYAVASRRARRNGKPAGAAVIAALVKPFGPAEVQRVVRQHSAAANRLEKGQS